MAMSDRVGALREEMVIAVAKKIAAAPPVRAPAVIAAATPPSADGRSYRPDPIDVCGLLSTDEASAILGAAVTTDRVSEERMDRQMGLCRYVSDNGTVTLTARAASELDGYKELLGDVPPPERIGADANVYGVGLQAIVERDSQSYFVIVRGDERLAQQEALEGPSVAVAKKIAARPATVQ